MLLDGEVLVKGVVLRTDSEHLSDFLYLSVAVDGEIAFVGVRHPRKHGDRCCLSGAVVAQQRENLSLVHTHCQVVDCHYVFVFAPSELFPQRHDFDCLVVLLLTQQSLLHFLVDVSVGLLGEQSLFVALFLLDAESRAL